MADPIRVTGLREFQAGLRKMDAGLARALRLCLNEAAEVVVDAAEPHVPRRTGRAAASLRAQSSQRLSRVSAGGRQAPYYAWLDFGGRVGPNDNTVRYFLTRGRYIYPAYDHNKHTYQRVLESSLLRLAMGAGIDVDRAP
jgi:hypothetical protein